MHPFDPPTIAEFFLAACALMAAFAQLAAWLGVPL